MSVRHAASKRAVFALAWPAALSYLLNNSYRINDQYWIQGLGEEAQAAIGGVIFVTILYFALVFLAAGGTLALVAQATGARDPERRDAVVRHALLAALGISALLAVFGPMLTPLTVAALGLESHTAELAGQFLATLYLFSLPMVLAPAIDHVLLGMGNTLLPALLQLLAVALNYVLNPMLIYGARAAEAGHQPGAALAASVASALGIEGRGMAGAALATVISRGISVTLGLVCLRGLFGVRFLPRRGRDSFDPALLKRILAISLPVSFSIVAYASVYLALIKFVMVPLGEPAIAGLGLGFSVFEGVSYPCYLGLAMASASLVGRSLGARDLETAWRAVRSSRRIATVVGLGITAGFLLLGPIVAPNFSSDPDVVRTTRSYVFALAFSQVAVAHESVHEKILLGAGFTRAPMWVSMLGNLLRIPLAWLFAFALGFGAPGVWWAINCTSVLKAVFQFRLVQRGAWAARARAPLPGTS